MYLLWEPSFTEGKIDSIRTELSRFPYMSDKNRTDEKIDDTIVDLFFSRTSMALEYGGGYIIFRRIGARDGRKTADLFWIHFPDCPFTHNMVRFGRDVIDKAGVILDLECITMKTAAPGVARMAARLGFEIKSIDPHGFEWYGRKVPLFHLSKEV